MDLKSVKYEIIQAKDGNPTVLVESGGKKLPLHSRINPGREGEAYREKFNPEKYDGLIVLGTGLGYHLLPLVDILEKYKIVIFIDILEGIETQISNNSLTSSLLKSGNTVIFSGLSPELISVKLSDYIDLENISGLSVVEHVTSVRIFSEYYNRIKKDIGRILNRQAGSLSAKKAFGHLYLRNIIKNLKFMENCRGVSSVSRNQSSVFSDYPVMVITSGPSLDNYVREIKESSEYFFIIAVDSALPVLFSYGIIPDFAVSIDPQPYIYEHFNNIDLSATVPVFSISAHWSLVKKYGGFISLNTHPLSQLIEDLYPGKIGSIDSRTGSVAGDAIMLAVKAGFGSIGLTGFDFSFNSFNIYARGTAYQKRYAEYFQNRLLNIETSNFNYVMNSSKGYISRGKFTRKSFVQYMESIEEFISRYNNNFYNINSTGIPFNGVENSDFQKFFEKACDKKIMKRELIESIISKETGKVPDMDRLYKLILSDDVFNRVYDASIEGSPGISGKEKVKLLAESLLIGESSV